MEDSRIQTIYETIEFVSKVEESQRQGGKFSKSFQTIHQLLHDKSKTDLSVPPDDANAISFRYTIPKEICMSAKTGRDLFSEVTLSALLSLFDEVTSWLIMSVDRRKRGGVSVALGCHLADTHVAMPEAGDVVEILAKVDKIGRNLGFASFEARRVDTGQRICIGYHTKFLPMGWLFETAMGPYLYPITRAAVMHFSSEKAENGEGQSLSDLLKIGVINDNGTSDSTSSSSKYTFNITDDHWNAVGTLHGGCQAMIYEEVGRRIMQAECSANSLSAADNNLLHLESIHIDYLTTESKGVTLDYGLFNIGINRALMRVEMKSSNNGSKVVSRCKMTWSSLDCDSTMPRASM